MTIQEKIKQALKREDSVTPSDDLRIIPTQIDDAYILDTDEVTSEETLRLGIIIDGKQVLMRFPKYGQWDKYVTDLAKLMGILAMTGDKIIQNMRMTDLEDLNKDQFQVWAKLSAVALRLKKVSNLTQYIFFKYLRPTIKDMNKHKSKKWIKNNMSMDILIRMFICILHPEDYLKKKSELQLRKTFQVVTALQSSQQSEKKQDGQSGKLIRHQFSQSVSFSSE